MGAVLGSAFYAYETGRVFALDMREVIFFAQDAHAAFFENFELQLPPGMEVITDLEKIDRLKKDADLHFVNLATPLDINRPFPNRVVMVPCITPGDPFKPALRRPGRVFRINLKGALAESLNRAMSLPYWKKRVIGLHYRATMGELFERMTKLTVPDYDERYQLVKDEYVDTALKLVAGLSDDEYAFLVASDDRAFVAELKSRLPNSFSIGTLRLDQEFMAYMKANKHNIAILVDAVTDLWALSRCEQLVFSRSAFTHFAIMNSEHLGDDNTHYIHMPLFDEILNSLPPPTAVEWARAAVQKIDISRMHYDKMHRFLADACIRAGEDAEAQYARQRADWHNEAAHAPEIDNPDVFAERAEQKQGKQSLALARAKRAAESMPSNPYFQGGFGGSLSTLYLANGMVTEAVDAAWRATQLDPRDAFLRDHYATVLLRAGNYAEAAVVAQQAIDMLPTVASFHINCGYALARLGEGAAAGDCVRRAIDLEPDAHRSHASAGDIFLQVGSYAEAEQALRKALEIDKEDIGSLHRLSIAIERQRRFSEALEFARVITVKVPENPDFRNRVASLLALIGDKGAAESALRAELDAAPTNAKVYEALANNLIGQDRKLEAIEILRHGINTVPENGGLLARYGSMMLASERYEEAEDALSKAAKIDEKNVGVRHMLSITFERRRKFGDAIVAAVAAMDLDPTNPDRVDRLVAVARRFAREGSQT